MGDPTTGHSESSGSLDGVGYSPSPADGTTEKSAASAVAEEKVSLGVMYLSINGVAVLHLIV
jgi:hypothetical protein